MIRDYLSKVNQTEPNLDAPWVKVLKIDASLGQKVWRCVLIHHLTGAENGGNHHVYVDLIDDSGKPLVNPSQMLGWTWVGKRDDEPANDVRFDKAPPEPGANINLGKGQIASVWIKGGLSDVVMGLRTDPPVADEPGNSTFHHSTYVVFQRVMGGLKPPTPQPLTLEERFSALEKRVLALEKSG